MEGGRRGAAASQSAMRAVTGGAGGEGRQPEAQGET